MRECAALGWRTLLLTGESLKNSNWPREALDAVYTMPDPDKEWNPLDTIHAVSYLVRETKIDKIVPLDDFDVEKAAALREHLRIAGMGDTTARNFRDKLAMRGRALDAGIPIPRFVGILNHEDIRKFTQEVPAPWVLKPRFQANALGIKKIASAEQLWQELDQLGDKQSYHLLEEFVEGEIAHVDSAVVDYEMVFHCESRYGTPPFEVFHGGRVFTTQTLHPEEPLAQSLYALNQRVIKGLGLKFGVSHAEFIVPKFGSPLFLETSARVGGAHIAEMVEAATGVNLWRAWARMETASDPSHAVPVQTRHDFAALLVTLAHQEWPDLRGYADPEVVWRLHKRHHAGLILQSADSARINQLVNSYQARFYEDFFAHGGGAEKASQLG